MSPEVVEKRVLPLFLPSFITIKIDLVTTVT